MKDASGMGDVSHKKSPSRDSVESTTSAKCDEVSHHIPNFRRLGVMDI